MLSGGEGEVCSSMMMGKEVVVVADAVEAASSSKLVRVVRIVRIRLCTLSKCEDVAVDMISPRDWSKWVRRSIDF